MGGQTFHHTKSWYYIDRFGLGGNLWSGHGVNCLFTLERKTSRLTGKITRSTSVPFRCNVIIFVEVFQQKVVSKCCDIIPKRNSKLVCLIQILFVTSTLSGKQGSQTNQKEVPIINGNIGPEIIIRILTKSRILYINQFLHLAEE